MYKEDSQSTPVRLVVDPTMNGLNILLAKDVSALPFSLFLYHNSMDANTEPDI